MKRALGLANRLWGAIVVALGVISGLGYVLSDDFRKQTRPPRHAIRDAATWAYPLPLVILLGFTVVALAIGLMIVRRRGRIARLTVEQGRPNDVRLVRELLNLLPRGALEFPRDHPHGAPWRHELMMPFIEFMQRDDIEYHFTDPALEDARKTLSQATHDWINSINQSASLGAGGMMSVRPPRYPDPQPADFRRWEAEAEELDRKADKVVEAYDAFIKATRARGIFPTSNEPASV